MKGFQVLILLAPQAGHCEIPDGVQVVWIAATCDFPIGGLHRFARQISASDIFNVATLIAIGGPVRVVGVFSQRAGLHRQRQIVDLLACIVVVELALYRPPRGFQQSAQRVTNGCASPVAHVEGSCWIGGHEFHLHPPATAGISPPVCRAALENGAYDLGMVAGVNKKVDEAGSGDVAAVNQCVCGKRRDQLGGELPGHHTRALGHHHGNVARQITMTRIFRAIDLRCRLGHFSQHAI